jgi:hypothetical protein
MDTDVPMTDAADDRGDADSAWNLHTETADDPADEPPTPTEIKTGDDLDEDLSTTLRRNVQTFRMDLGAALNFEELFWRFVVPWFATSGLIFTVLGRVVIGAASTAVAGAVYITMSWHRRRTLAKLRNEDQEGAWSSSACLVKSVSVPEQTVYLAWMGGHQYADSDPDRLARKVADRWASRLRGEAVAPAMQEKYARNLRRFNPLFHQFRQCDPDEGWDAIYHDMVGVLREAADPDGMVPKSRFAERVVQRGEGVGHDPDIVAEIYHALTPEVFAETEVDLRTEDGDRETVVAVHLRHDTVPEDDSQLRAQFSDQFRAGDVATYPLPEVSVGPGTTAPSRPTTAD